MRSPLFAALFTLLLPLHALAAGLSGTWTLDKAASQDLTPLLAAEGAPAIERGIVSRMSVTQVIDDAGDRIHLELQSVLRDKSMDLILDGVERTEPGDHGPTQATHVRGPDGVVTSTIRFDARHIARDGVPTEIAAVRLLNAHVVCNSVDCDDSGRGAAALVRDAVRRNVSVRPTS